MLDPFAGSGTTLRVAALRVVGEPQDSTIEAAVIHLVDSLDAHRATVREAGRCPPRREEGRRVAAAWHPTVDHRGQKGPRPLRRTVSQATSDISRPAYTSTEGWNWVTTHSYRETVAIHMNHAGLPSAPRPTNAATPAPLQ